MNATFSYAGYMLAFWENFLFSNGLKTINIAQENPWYIFASSAGDEWLLDVNSQQTASRADMKAESISKSDLQQSELDDVA